MKIPVFEQHQLFTALANGYYSYRIPSLILTKKSTLIAFCEAREDSGSDWAHSAIIARRCPSALDNFKVWEEQFIVKESNARILPRNATEEFMARKQAEARGTAPIKNQPYTLRTVTNNPVPIVDQEIDLIHLVYCEDYHNAYYTYSGDDGKTWSESINITPVFETFKTTYDWTVIASGPGQGLQLQTGSHKGRLIVPVWLASNQKDLTAHQPSQAATIYSDDHGQTWKAGEFVPFTIKDPNESKTIQRQDGSVMLYSRTNQPLDHEKAIFHKAFSTSVDGTQKWRCYQFDHTLPEPRCMGSIISYEGKWLYTSPNPEAVGKPFQERINLSIWMSEDEGKTWNRPKTIDIEPSAYSDLAVDPENGWIYVLYENDYKKTQYGRAGGLAIARFNLDWLLD